MQRGFFSIHFSGLADYFSSSSYTVLFSNPLRHTLHSLFSEGDSLKWLIQFILLHPSPSISTLSHIFRWCQTSSSSRHTDQDCTAAMSSFDITSTWDSSSLRKPNYLTLPSFLPVMGISTWDSAAPGRTGPDHWRPASHKNKDKLKRQEKHCQILLGTQTKTCLSWGSSSGPSQQPCRCPLRVRTTGWRPHETASTASRTPPAPIQPARPAPASAPWPW